MEATLPAMFGGLAGHRPVLAGSSQYRENQERRKTKIDCGLDPK